MSSVPPANLAQRSPADGSSRKWDIDNSDSAPFASMFQDDVVTGFPALLLLANRTRDRPAVLADKVGKLFQSLRRMLRL